MGEHVRAVVRLRPLHVKGVPRKSVAKGETAVASVEGHEAVRVQLTPATHQLFKCDCAFGPEDDQAQIFARSGE
jgi:hypothetical protein